jgi:hypothetical protein
MLLAFCGAQPLQSQRSASVSHLRQGLELRALRAYNVAEVAIVVDCSVWGPVVHC